MVRQSSARMVDAAGPPAEIGPSVAATIIPDAILTRTANAVYQRASIEAAIRKIVDNEAAAIRVEGFVPPDELAASTERVEALLGSQASASSIYLAVQTPLFEAANDPVKLALLQTAGLTPELEIDALFAPFASPWAAFTRTVDAEWPSGIKRLRVGGKRLAFGLLRGWAPGSHAEPHQDVLRRETTTLPVARRLKRQIGVNLHLSEADGGDLLVWNKQVDDAEWADHGPPGSYGYAWEDLGGPDLVIHAGPGDVTLVNTANIHAIATVRSGLRLTISGFLGYLSDAEPLEAWS